jgi:hypothetical protein
LTPGGPLPAEGGKTGRANPFSESLMTDRINISSSRTRFFAPWFVVATIPFPPPRGEGNKFCQGDGESVLIQIGEGRGARGGERGVRTSCNFVISSSCKFNSIVCCGEGEKSPTSVPSE